MDGDCRRVPAPGGRPGHAGGVREPGPRTRPGQRAPGRRDHYRKFKIQPWDIIDEYDLSFYEGSALKYLLRSKGDRLEDLKKARHYLDKLIEIEEGKDAEA